ncbi:hypothetical protein H9Q72_014528, partial [Fusarium xylarioides]
ESLHSSIKRWLYMSTGDLTTVFQRLCVFWQHQDASITTLQLQGRNKMRTITMQLLYILIRDQISPTALRLIAKEHAELDRNLSKPPKGTCYPCPIVTAYGLPCKHMIWRRLHQKEPIQLEEVDQH